MTCCFCREFITGTTDDGTFNVRFAVLVPISVDPLYVLHVIAHVPLTALGICAARSDGIDHTTLVPISAPIVPEALPKAYVSV